METHIDDTNSQTQQSTIATGSHLGDSQGSPHQRRPHLSRSGFAMVLILLVLALVAITATYFMQSAARERRVAEIYADGNRVRMYTDAVVNLVMGLINTATREGAEASAGGTVDLRSWATQPGLIRTFKQNGEQGPNTFLSRTYKLYSWDSLITVHTSFDPLDPDFKVPEGWDGLPAVFVDLNEPSNDTFPIADPRATFGVEGFSYDSTINGVVFPSNAEDSNARLPMPVMWLYMLEDGTLVAPQEGGDKTTAIVPGASPENPIVGRVAFWTDDETSKVNINVASEGTFWDWPKGSTRDEMQFAGNPPQKAEYSRIPGHPAMTSLSAVFSEMNPGPRWQNNGQNVAAGYPEKLARLETLNPRTGTKTEEGLGIPSASQGGTRPVWKLTQRYSVTRDPQSGQDSRDVRLSYDEVEIPQIAVRSDRLFPSTDDMVFLTQYNRDNTRAENVDLLAGLVEGTDLSDITKESYEKFAHRSQFFLTTTSRAPETTLFETPRVSLWPITWPHKSSYFQRVATTKHPWVRPDPPKDFSVEHIPTTLLSDTKFTWMTPEERLLAFASTLNYATNLNELENEGRYFWQRMNPDSPTHDIDLIPRNQALLSYLHRLGSQVFPGFGRSFAQRSEDPLSFHLDSVLVKAFDYSRAQINQYTAWSGGFNSTSNTDASGVKDYSYSYTGVAYGAQKDHDNPDNNINRETAGYQELGAFSVVPIRVARGTIAGSTATDRNQHGMGSFPKLCEVSLMFYGTKRREPEYIMPGARPHPLYEETEPWIEEAIPDGPDPDFGEYANNSAFFPGVPANPTDAVWTQKKREKMAAVANGPQNPENWKNMIFTGPEAWEIIDAGLPRPPNLTAGQGGASQTEKMRAVLFLDFTNWSSSRLQMNPIFWVKIGAGSEPISLSGGATGTINFNGRASQVTAFIGTSAVPEWARYLFCRDTGDENEPVMAKGMGDPRDGVRPEIGSDMRGNSNNYGYNRRPEPKDANCWTFVTLDIETRPDMEFFEMSGGKFVIELYGVDSGDVDRNPTNNEDMMIARYVVDFDKASGRYAIPLMPYWSGEHRTDAYKAGGIWYEPRFGIDFPGVDAVVNSETGRIKNDPTTHTMDKFKDIGYQSGRIPRPYSWAKDAGPSGNTSLYRNTNYPIQERVLFRKGHDTEELTETEEKYTPPNLKHWQVIAASAELVPNLSTSAQGDEGKSVNSGSIPAGYNNNVEEPVSMYQAYQYYAHPVLGMRRRDGSPDANGMYLFSGDLEKRVAYSMDMGIQGPGWGITPFRQKGGRGLGGNGNDAARGFMLITPYDTVVSMIPRFESETLSGNPIAPGSDPRLLADSNDDSSASAIQVEFIAARDARIVNYSANPPISLAKKRPEAKDIYSWGFDITNPSKFVRNTMSEDNIGPADTIYRSRAHRTAMGGHAMAAVCSRFNYQFHNLGRQTYTGQKTGYRPISSLFASGDYELGNIPMALFAAGTFSGGPISWGLGGSVSFTDNAGRFIIQGGDSRYPFSNYLGTIHPSVVGLGDWTILNGDAPDGGIIQRPDQEYQRLGKYAYATGSAYYGYATPYFQPDGPYAAYTERVGTTNVVRSPFDAYFSPNRQVPSPVTLGTLPSTRSVAWQTLAFNPNPFAGIRRLPGDSTGHPGTEGIPPNALPSSTGVFPRSPDHLLLDFFWMPVCEPYPISDQFSTAGKVNLNYQMMPFTYIKRQTALHAALKSTWIYGMTINNSPLDTIWNGNTYNGQSALLIGYKNPWLMSGTTTAFYRGGSTGTAPGIMPTQQFAAVGSRFGKTRYPIDVPATLEYFDSTVFNKGDIFRSASQLCEAFLVPDSRNTTLNEGAPITADNVHTFWDARQLWNFGVTPSNGRQAPYDHLYSRITTKSNTYTVHWRVQSLRKLPSGNAEEWDENYDRVVAEARGSTLIERYIDPNAKNIPDYAATNSDGSLKMSLAEMAANPLSNYYRWRIVANTKFNP